MKIQGFIDTQTLFLWPALSLHRYPWGWALLLCFMGAGIDLSYDYREASSSEGRSS
jgi:hypothetical protein